MIKFRPSNATDLDAIYDITLVTGDRGFDASALHNDPKLLGHVWSAPYVNLCPDLTFVAEENEGVVGYVVGALNTNDFENQMEQEWWPSLRAAYKNLDRHQFTRADQSLINWIENPSSVPSFVTDRFPAHMHMNILGRARGMGVGRRLFELWAKAAEAQGAQNIHIGAHPANSGGIAFWARCGFRPIEGPHSQSETAAYTGLSLSSDPTKA